MIANMLLKLPYPYRQQMTLFLHSLGTPILLLLGPRFISSDDRRVQIDIPFGFIARNGVGSMFFGAIAAGVDITGGWHTVERDNFGRVMVVYKEATIKFLRRIDGPLSLICDNGVQISETIRDLPPGERFNVPVTVQGYNFNYSRTDPVVVANLVLSLKKII